MHPHQATFVAALVVSASSFLLSCSKSSDPPAPIASDELYGPAADPIEVREYRGEPSSVVCGVRWSHDHESVYCDGGRVSLKEFIPFGKLRSLRLADVAIDVGDGAVPRLEGVRILNLHNPNVPASLVVDAFPNVESLWVHGMAAPVADLRGLDQLERITLSHVVAPDAQALLAFPKLRTVGLVYLRCPEPRCEFRLGWELKGARPEMEVRVMGRELKPANDAGPGSGT